MKIAVPSQASRILPELDSTATWLAAVAKGLRLMTRNRIQTLLQVSSDVAQAHLHAWEAAQWIAPVPDLPGRHYVVTETCPGVPDQDTLDHEIALALAAPRMEPDAGAIGFGYRTALVLHGLSETFDYGAFFVCRLRPGAAGAVPLGDVPFVRQWDEPSTAAKRIWAGRQIVVVQRDQRMLEGGTLDQIASGLPLTTPARTLVDCWLRPGYGVGDDRLLAAWSVWWRDPRFGGRLPKAKALRRVLQADQDHRPGRQSAFADFLGAVDPALVDELRRLGPELP